MKRRCLILFLSLLCILPQGYAQRHLIDSLQNALKRHKDDTSKISLLCEIVKQAYSCQSDSTDSIIKKSTDEGLALADRLNSANGKLRVLIAIGTSEQIKKPGYALSELFEGLKLAESLKNINSQFEINRIISSIYYRLGNYSEDAVYAYKNLKIAEQMHDSVKLGTAYNQLGNLYSDEGNYADAIKFHGKDLQFELKRKDSLKISHEYVNLGIDYLGIGKYDSAIYYSYKALSIQIPKNNIIGEAYSLDNIGESYLGRKDYQKALGFFLKGSQYLEPYQDASQKVETWNDIGKTYLELKNYTEALKFYFQAADLAVQDKMHKYLVYTYQGLSDVYEATHNTTAALKYYKLYSSYKDTVFNSEKANKISSLAYQYRHEKEEGQYQFEEEKTKLKHEAELKRERILIYSFVVGFILLLGLLFYMYRSFRNKHKANIIIGRQNKMMEVKQKEIIDSITYAKRLQDAIIPPISLIKKYVPESFVLYKPKDIVAGDFYWMERQGDNILIAAADCTGHGVPGALVSVICSNALNRTVKEFHITEPGKILDKVRELVLETFEKSESNVQDGMDISLCCLNTKTNEMQWSGAYNSLWYIQNGEMKELPADKQPIGKVDKPQAFNTYNLNLQKGDTLYLFTDGYADQFGGPKGKKFKYKPMEELLFANATKPMEEQKNILENTLNEWKGTLEQVDDILMIGIRIS